MRILETLKNHSESWKVLEKSWKFVSEKGYEPRLSSSDSCVRYHTLVLAVIFQVISVLPFSTKNAFVTAYLLESSLARLKNVVCCFQTISCLLSFKEGKALV